MRKHRAEKNVHFGPKYALNFESMPKPIVNFQPASEAIFSQVSIMLGEAIEWEKKRTASLTAEQREEYMKCIASVCNRMAGEPVSK